jgi:tetratricopeptide (TPR) repeat protein
VLSIRPRYRGPVAEPLHQNLAFWLLVAAAPLPLIGFRTRDRRRRSTVVETPLDRLESLIRAPVSDAAVPARIRRAFGEALGERLGLPPTVFTRPGALARALRRSGVSRDVADQCETLMRELDGAAYSRESVLTADAAARAVALFNRADEEALPRYEIRLPLSALGILFIAAMGVSHLSAAPTLTETFDHGVAAYGEKNYQTAEQAFAAVARAEPRGADAWANYGTAAWAAGDTAHAVAGWQRALRLEPLAGDVRDRIDLAHGVPIGSAGYVPPVPLSGVAAVAILMWLGGFGFAAWQASRLRPLGAPAIAMAIAGGIALLGTLGLEDQLHGKRVAIVAMSIQLHEEPILESQRAANALIGETVHVRSVQGAWTRIQLDDGREGWIDSADLIPVDYRAPFPD